MDLSIHNRHRNDSGPVDLSNKPADHDESKSSDIKQEPSQTWAQQMRDLEAYHMQLKIVKMYPQMEEFMQSWRTMTEDQLARMVMFKVEDQDVPPVTSDRARQSLPSTLSLRPSCSRYNKDFEITGVWSNVPIPPGTRFGPLVGTKYSAEEAEPVADKKYFWRVFDRLRNSVMWIRDGKDVTRANWMRYVQPAYHGQGQNMVAYQDGHEVYFLTVRQIKQDEELFVWYSYDFAKRIQVPTYHQAYPSQASSYPQQQHIEVRFFSRPDSNCLAF